MSYSSPVFYGWGKGDRQIQIHRDIRVGEMGFLEHRQKVLETHSDEDNSERKQLLLSDQPEYSKIFRFPFGRPC